MESRPGSWRVADARFELSATNVGQCPSSALPEIAIAGRSNVGKSSLLNALCGQRGLARVSRTPGRTQLLNVFTLTLRGPTAQERKVRCVDLPGYGYAAARKQVREAFAPMIGGYLADREALRALILLVDLRRGVRELDLELLESVQPRGLPSLLVATKADKLGAAARPLARKQIAAAVGVRPGDVLLTSSNSGAGIKDGALASDIAMLTGEDP